MHPKQGIRNIFQLVKLNLNQKINKIWQNKTLKNKAIYLKTKFNHFLEAKKSISRNNFKKMCFLQIH